MAGAGGHVLDDMVNPKQQGSPIETSSLAVSHHRTNGGGHLSPGDAEQAQAASMTILPFVSTPRSTSARTELVLARALKRVSSRHEEDTALSPSSIKKSPPSSSGSRVSQSAQSPLRSPRDSQPLTSPRILKERLLRQVMEGKAIEDRRNQLVLSNSIHLLEGAVRKLEATVSFAVAQVNICVCVY